MKLDKFGQTQAPVEKLDRIATLEATVKQQEQTIESLKWQISQVGMFMASFGVVLDTCNKSDAEKFVEGTL